VGFKNLFSSSNRAKGKVDKLIKTATNPYAQSADRYHAMEQLLSDASQEALVGLLRRFTMVSTKSIEDEEEKGWVYRQLSGLGPKVLEPTKTFCIESDNIAWALRIVEDVADEAQEWDILDALLERHPPGYERDPSKKLQLLTHLAEIEDPQVPRILERYLEDPDEQIRYFVVEQLFDFGDEDSREPLLKRLLNPEEESMRVRTKILDGLADSAWDVGDHKQGVVANLGHEHALEGGKVVRR
jgi:hypothetical protein